MNRNNYSSVFLDSLKSSTPKRREVQIRTVSNVKPTIKQYGDKGYKPSTGLGVGY